MVSTHHADTLHIYVSMYHINTIYQKSCILYHVPCFIHIHTLFIMIMSYIILIIWMCSIFLFIISRPTPFGRTMTHLEGIKVALWAQRAVGWYDKPQWFFASRLRWNHGKSCEVIHFQGLPNWDHRCLSWSSFLKQVVELKEFFSCDSWRFESKCRGYEVEDLESMNNSKSANFVIFSSEISLDSWLKREAKHHLQVEIAELLLLRLTRCWKWQGALDSSTSDTPPWNKHRNPKKWWVSKTRISFLKKQILLHPRRHGSYKSPT